MNNYGNDLNFTELDLPARATCGVYNAVAEPETEHFQDEYKAFEFEATTEAPSALAAFVFHQQTIDL